MVFGLRCKDKVQYFLSKPSVMRFFLFFVFFVFFFVFFVRLNVNLLYHVVWYGDRFLNTNKKLSSTFFS